ncbi:MAG: hypothetical protein ACNA7K_02550 [Acholeplasmataceae bacterium]
MQNIRRVYISLLSVVLFTFIFGTATYAWISINSINSIDGLSLTATTGEQLQISIDGINYQQFLETETLEAIFGDVQLKDITSLNGKTFYTGGLRMVGPAVANEDYLSFELWFRTKEVERHVYLVNNVSSEVTYDQTMLGTYVVSRGVRWVSKHTFLNGPGEEDIVNQGDEGIYYGSEAIRISIEEIKAEENALDIRGDEAFRTIIYDPSENPSRGYGTFYGAYHYFMISTGNTFFSLPPYRPDILYRLTTFEPYDPYQAQDNDSLVAELIESDMIDDEGNIYYIGKIRVNVWIEGWDADAFDAIHRDRIKMQLQFKSGKPFIELG